MRAARALAALPLLLGPRAAGQDRPLPIASADMVSVDVSVVREGRAVPGLTADRFEVRDDGVRRAVEVVGAGEMPLDVLILLDASDSVGGEHARRLVRAASALFPDLRAGDRAGLMAFTEQVRLLADVGSSPAAVRALLARVPTGGGTSLRDAVWSALKRAEAVRGRLLVLILTDGTDTSSWLPEAAVLEMARDSSCVVHVVRPESRAAPSPAEGAGEGDAGGEFLGRLAAATGGRMWESDAAQDLELGVRRALAEMRSRYVLRFERPPEARPGWHRLEVKLKGVKGDVLARRGYFVAAPR